jgi:hypothetical protein
MVVMLNSGRWFEHFNKILNRNDPPTPADIHNTETEELCIDVNPPTIEEVKAALKELKNGKDLGIDSITSETLKSQQNKYINIFNISRTPGQRGVPSE